MRAVGTAVLSEVARPPQHVRPRARRLAVALTGLAALTACKAPYAGSLAPELTGPTTAVTVTPSVKTARAAEQPSPPPGASTASPVTVLANDVVPDAVAIDDTRVYWIGDHALQSIPLRSAGPRTLVARVANRLGSPRLAVDSGTVLWTENSSDGTEPGKQSLVRQSLDGGVPVRLVALVGERSLGCLVVADGDVYWVQQERIMRSAKGSERPSPLGTAIDPGHGEACLAVDATNVYAAREAAVVSTKKTGGAPTKLFAVSRTPRDLHVDVTHLYWSNGETLLRAAKSGADPQVEVIARAPSRIRAIALDDEHVYFTVPGSPTGTPDGSVWRVAKNGEKPTMLASAQPFPTVLAVGRDAVVWGCEGLRDSDFRRTAPGTLSSMSISTR